MRLQHTLYIALLLSFIILFPSLSISHPGGVDSQGGHTNKKTGKYHSHKKKSESPASNSEYDRDDWPHWVDEDSDCQNTRAEILIRDNVGTIKFKRSKSCSVSQGVWVCPYTGNRP